MARTGLWLVLRSAWAFRWVWAGLYVLGTAHSTTVWGIVHLDTVLTDIAHLDMVHTQTVPSGTQDMILLGIVPLVMEVWRTETVVMGIARLATVDSVATIPTMAGSEIGLLS